VHRGSFAQNVVTGRPKTEGLASAAIEGAAVQGGMHLGMGFMESMGEAVNEVEASKLRLRSQEKFEEAVGQIFQGDESLRIPAQEFVNYFVDKDIDPAEMARPCRREESDGGGRGGIGSRDPERELLREARS
jgi:hypothetical protein